MPEILHFLPKTPIVLVGNKQDLRNDAEEHAKEVRRGDASEIPTTYEQGEAYARKIGAYKYLECSAKLGTGIQEVLEAAVRAAVLGQQQRSRGRISRFFRRSP